MKMKEPVRFNIFNFVDVLASGKNHILCSQVLLLPDC